MYIIIDKYKIEVSCSIVNVEQLTDFIDEAGIHKTKRTLITDEKMGRELLADCVDGLVGFPENTILVLQCDTLPNTVKTHYEQLCKRTVSSAG